MALEFDLDGVDDQRIDSLLELLACSDVAECEIEQGECRLSIRRQVRERSDSGEQAQSPPPDGWARDEPITVRAPAVGIFRRSDRRSGSARVEVGSRVKVGDVLGSIDVVAVPHVVRSTHEGIVESFLVEDGQPVEYGQPLVALSSGRREV